MARYPLLGVSVDAMTMHDLNEAILRASRENARIIIANHNTHSVYLFHHDAKMREFYSKAEKIHVDGMPLIFVGRLLGRPLRRVHRVTYVDWIRPLMAEAVRHGLRVFYLGSRPGVADRAAAILRAEFPGL